MYDFVVLIALKSSNIVIVFTELCLTSFKVFNVLKPIHFEPFQLQLVRKKCNSVFRLRFLPNK